MRTQVPLLLSADVEPKKSELSAVQRRVQAGGEGNMQAVLVDVQRNGVGGNHERRKDRVREVSERREDRVREVSERGQE